MSYEEMLSDLRHIIKQRDDIFTKLERYGEHDKFIGGIISGLDFALDEMEYIELLEKRKEQ